MLLDYMKLITPAFHNPYHGHQQFRFVTDSFIAGITESQNMAEGNSVRLFARLLYSCSTCGLPGSLSAKLISSQLNPCIVRWAYSVSSARHLICLARTSVCQLILPAYKDPSEGQACRSVLPDPVSLVPTVRFLRVLFVPSSKSPMKMLNSISPVLKPVALS